MGGWWGGVGGWVEDAAACKPPPNPACKPPANPMHVRSVQAHLRPPPPAGACMGSTHSPPPRTCAMAKVKPRSMRERRVDLKSGSLGAS